MIEVVSLLIVLVMSLIITRVATVALSLTGMSQQSARFQARSALTGAGFTTAESERVVNHPLRRRIIMSLMLIGNTGLVLAASLMVVLLGADRDLSQRSYQLIGLLGGLILLFLVARSSWLERWLSGFIERVLARHTDLGRSDHSNLLRLGGEYRVVEMAVEERDWIAGRDLSALQLPKEGVLVLGVIRGDGAYTGAPGADTVLEAGDVAVLYGKESSLAELDRRRAGPGGQLRHGEAVARAAADQAEQGDGEEEPA